MKWDRIEVKPGEVSCTGCLQMKKFFNDHNQEPPYQCGPDETVFWVETGTKRVFCQECMEEIWND